MEQRTALNLSETGVSGSAGGRRMSKEVGSYVIWTVLVLFNVSWLGTGKQTGFADVPPMSENAENDTRRILKLHGVFC